MKFAIYDISDIFVGGTPSTQNESYWGGTIPWLSVNDFKGDNKYVYSAEKTITELGLKKSATKLLNKNDIIISARGTVGELAVIPYKMAYNQSCYGLKAKEDLVNSDYLYYILKNSVDNIKRKSYGSVFDTITINTFKDIVIDLPNLEYQRVVSNFLSNIDLKIEINNKINDNLEQQMHLIFEDMMAKAINNKIKGEFIVAKSLTQVITGKEDANFSVTNGKYKFFTCSNTPLHCDEYAFNSSSVLIAGNGDFNVKHYSGKFNAYQRTYVLSPQKEYYAILYLAALYRINSFKTGSSGSIVKFITKSDVENIPVFMPHDSKYLDELNKLVIMQEQNMLENELLVQLRDWLLPMLMNGQATIEQ